MLKARFWYPQGGKTDVLGTPKRDLNSAGQGLRASHYWARQDRENVIQYSLILKTTWQTNNIIISRNIYVFRSHSNSKTSLELPYRGEWWFPNSSNEAALGNQQLMRVRWGGTWSPSFVVTKQGHWLKSLCNLRSIGGTSMEFHLLCSRTSNFSPDARPIK
jgi:hypothetical protein